MTGYMRDWLERPGEPASDLDLVVLLLNSLDLLDDPPDRLTGLDWLGEVLAAVGREDIGGALTAEDLPGLRQLRESLRAVFQAKSHVSRLGSHELFQWAGHDIFVGASVRKQFAAAAPLARVDFYPTAGHQLTTAAQTARDAFLAKQLALSG